MKLSTFHGTYFLFHNIVTDLLASPSITSPVCVEVFLTCSMSSLFICLERKSACFEDESELFIEVDCFNVEPVLCPTPEGLTQQQVTNVL